MAKTKKKDFKIKEHEAKDVPKGSYKDIDWEGQEIEFHSDELKGGTDGSAVVMRFFDFKANSQAFKTRPPSVQELFNTHSKEIELGLWKDGLKPIVEVQPRFMASKDKKYYRFVIAATPMRGQMVTQTPKTLTEILNENRTAPANRVEV